MNGFNLTLFGFLLCIFNVADGITLPPEIHDRALWSVVTTSSTCQSTDVGFTCNSSCPTRTQTPVKFETLLKVKNSECENITEDIDLPHAVVDNGGVFIDNSTENCTAVNASTVTGVAGYFTVSMWVTHSCDNCTLFTIGPNFHFPSTHIEKNSWKHVAIQYNGAISLFVSGDFLSADSSTDLSGGHNMSIGSQTELAPGENISFVDARWYDEVLTDREIYNLATGFFQTLPISSDCRCPPTAPTLVITNATYPLWYLTCTNRTTTGMVPRLGDAHPPVYMVDGEPTFWNSGKVKNVTVTLTIRKLYQISGIILEGLQNVPNSIDLVLKRGSTTTLTRTINNPAAFIRGATVFDMNITDEFAVTTRDEYEQMLADEIQLTLNSDGGETFYTVSEFKLVTRCACYGNVESCNSASSVNYTCACTGNTTGDHCESCVDKYYRGVTELGCTHECNCNSSGAMNTSCEEVGGQCTCKAQVSNDSRTCSECRHNSVGFGSDATNGCTPCLCNPDGIVDCTGNVTCVCKANVETDSGRCEHCIDDHYGMVEADGCTACGCGAGTEQSGGTFQSCDIVTGQCPCKTHVQGRTCDQCKDKYKNLNPVLPSGCDPCTCNFVGSETLDCTVDGQCTCRSNVTVNQDCEPANLHMDPDYGPLAGGTSVTITGDNLGGTNINVTVSIGIVQQTVLERTDSSIIFTTQLAQGIETYKVAVIWEDSLGTAHSYRNDVFEDATQFRYKPNPGIDDDQAKSFRTFASGGCSIHITGHDLDSVAYPALLVHTANGKTLSEICHHSTAEKMLCPTPNMTQYMTNGMVSFGFRLDNVQKFENFTALFPGISLIVVPDPVIDTDQAASFDNTFDNEITITGQRLDEACLDSDIRILVGGQPCAFKSRSATTITCDPGETFPGSSRDEDVLVVIGNTSVHWGKVTFIEFWKVKQFIYICVSVGCLIVVVMVLICVCCRCRRRRKHEMKKRDSALELVETAPGRSANIYVEPGSITNPVALIKPIQPDSPRTPTDITEAFIQRLHTDVSNAIKSSIIDRSHIEPGRTCTHKGKHIRVINGDFRQGSASSVGGTPVMIKTLVTPYPEDGELPSWLNNGLHECVKLQDSLHENVLRLMGVTVDAKHVYVIYPEMAHRTLKEYISIQTASFGIEKKQYCCVQVGEGMNYLDTENVVHKDLAARNCWVDGRDVIKISDASFSYDIYPDDYLFQNGRHQPVRWMAPESLKQSGFYSSKSDVWSYGVLMWEVFASGYTPYHDIKNNSDVSSYVNDKGYRLSKPHECPDKIYSVIEQCHSEIGEDRPNFFLILNQLSEIISPETGAPVSYENEEEEQFYMNSVQVAGVVELPPVPPRQKGAPLKTNQARVPPTTQPKPTRDK